IWAKLQYALKFRHRLGELASAVIIQSLQIVARHRIRIGLEHGVQFLNRTRVLAMLAVGHRVGKELVSLDAVLRIGCVRLLALELPPPEKPAYPSDFSLSIKAGSSPVFSASSCP